jgi:hypothetical protein
MINPIKTKNIIILLFIILVNCNVQSQVFDGNLASKSLKWSLEQKDFTSFPRVGIDPMSIKLWDNYNGTSSPSSYGSLLEINGRAGHLVSQMYFKSTWEGGRILYRSAFYNQTTWDEWRTLLDSKSDVESDGLLKIKGAGNSYITGNVGIGTASPEAKLDVNGTIQINGGANSFYGFGQASASKPIDARPNSRYPYIFNWHEGLTFSAHSAYGGIRFYNQGYPDMYGAGVMVMSITNNNVGIGTTNPTSKLTVAGDINSREVKVTVNAGADFVFENGYNLPSLNIVENYIKENKHLPEIASAKEMKENGINLSEMNIKLLQKMEEMTLYLIEQNKSILMLKEALKAQDLKIENLKAVSK